MEKEKRFKLPDNLEDWKEYAEMNLDFDNKARIYNFKIHLTAEELYLIGIYAIEQKNKKINTIFKGILHLIHKTPEMNKKVDFFGNIIE